jgi:Domain of unknown function (DUF5134)
MAPPSWLAAVLAAILLVIAGYCATRLAAARWWQRSTDHGADVMHTVMGVAMAGMLVPRLNPLQARAWAVLFAAGTAWFAGQAVRGRRRARATTGPPAPGGQHGAHVLSCSAMVCVLLAAPAAGAGIGADPGTRALPVVALILAVAVSISVVVSTDRFPALRTAPVPVTTAPAQATPTTAQATPTTAQATPTTAQVMPTTATGQDAAALFTPAPACARPVLCPRLASCCQIMMGVAMAYMLILML